MDTGAGNDSVDVPSPALGQGAAITGGDRVDVLRLTNDAPDLAIDMTSGTLTTPAGTPPSPPSSTRSSPREPAASPTEARRATTGSRCTRPPVLPFSTSAPPTGQDEIVVEPATIAAGSRIDGGIGRNGLVAANRTGTMSLDLMQQELVIDGRQMTVTGIQDAFLLSTEVEMIGDSRGNNLSFAGCEGTTSAAGPAATAC